MTISGVAGVFQGLLERLFVIKTSALAWDCFSIRLVVSLRPLLSARRCFPLLATLPFRPGLASRSGRRFLAFSLLLSVAIGIHPRASAAPLEMDLNRALQIGWHSLRVQNPFGTNYTGLTAIKSYNPAAREFVFLNMKGEDVVIKEEDISFIYFRQLPERSDINVKAGPIRNLQITPYREFLYDIRPGRLVIQDGILLMNTRWRIAEQKPFGVDLRAADVDRESGEQTEIPRRIQLNYLGNHYLVETEFVTIVSHDSPQSGGATVPRPQPTLFKVPAPSPNRAP